METNISVCIRFLRGSMGPIEGHVRFVPGTFIPGTFETGFVCIFLVLHLDFQASRFMLAFCVCLDLGT